MLNLLLGFKYGAFELKSVYVGLESFYCLGIFNPKIAKEKRALETRKKFGDFSLGVAISRDYNFLCVLIQIGFKVREPYFFRSDISEFLEDFRPEYFFRHRFFDRPYFQAVARGFP